MRHTTATPAKAPKLTCERCGLEAPPPMVQRVPNPKGETHGRCTNRVGVQRARPDRRTARREDSLMPRRISFVCDDAAGFQLRVLQADDGDFHVSVVPSYNNGDFDREHRAEAQAFAGCFSASVRVRAPMIGGGSHERLWHALAGLFQTLRSETIDGR